MGEIRKFQQLNVWQEGHELVLAIYEITRGFPSEERFGLVSQMRRAAVSIPANIAEGFKRRGIRDKIRFYNIAEGSLEETKYFLILAKDLNGSFGFCRATPSVSLKVAKNCVFVGITDLFRVVTGLWVGMV
jgi:four helix bundle protein